MTLLTQVREAPVAALPDADELVKRLRSVDPASRTEAADLIELQAAEIAGLDHELRLANGRAAAAEAALAEARKELANIHAEQLARPRLTPEAKP